jgi:predicted nucleic acid-binding protein
MSADERTLVIDTSVLLNFIVIDRLDLFADLHATTCLVTEHVRREITADRPDQIERLVKAIDREMLSEIRVDRLEEVDSFARLTAAGLGVGESSAFAVARHRGYVVGIDDRRAIRLAAKSLGDIAILGSAGIIREAIARNALAVAEADAIKDRWETRHRFKLPFRSFADP